MRWTQRAASKGNVDSMFNMGKFYEKGQGVALNYVVAFGWYRQAADKGDVEAMIILSAMYSTGTGVTKNCNIAKQWWDKSTASGGRTAAKVPRYPACR